MQKIKILYISHSAHINGAEVCLFTLSKYIDRSRFEPVIIFPSQGPLIKEIEDLGIKTYICPLERWIRYPFDLPVKSDDIHSRVQKIVDIIEKESIRLVHTNTTVIYEGAVAAKKKHIPHVWHVHETLEGHPELESCLPLPLTYWCMSFLSEKIVTVADSMKAQFQNIIDPAKLVTVYNGIDEKEFQSSGIASIRAELKISNDEIVAVIVGAVTERKGYPNLLRAASLVRQHGMKVKFLWVGAASDEVLSDFNTKIKEWNLRDSVIHLGFRKDVPAIIKEADFLVLSSINEGFPMVILEAMAAGKPVVVTDCGGVSEAVVEGETGFIVPVNNSEKLSEKIIEISRDKEKRNMMQERSVQRFNENFSASINAGNFENIYNGLININNIQQLSEKENVLFEAALQAYQHLSDQQSENMEKDKKLLQLNKKHQGGLKGIHHLANYFKR